jgi:hypothetical protein
MVVMGFLYLFPHLAWFCQCCSLAREKISITETLTIEKTRDPTVPSIDHRKQHARYKICVIPLIYGIFQGTYALSMWWAVIIGMDIAEPWDLSNEALLIYFAVGMLTYKKAPPWLASYLLTSIGFNVVRLSLPVLEFFLPTFRAIHSELNECRRFYLGARACARTVYLGVGRLLRAQTRLSNNASHLHSLDENVEGNVDATGIDIRFLDEGMFCQSVGTFPRMTANRATTQTRVAINSANLATGTLKHAGLGYHSFVLTFDSGASRMSTGCREDFTEFKTTGLQNLALDGIASGLKIEGIGIVLYAMPMDDGTRVTFKMKALYVPALGTTRLISPQGIRTIEDRPVTFMTHTNEDEHDSYAELWVKEKMEGWQHTMPLHTLRINYNAQDNLPKHMASLPGTADHCLKALTGAIDVTAASNQNLSKAQKELLKWHFRLGHVGFQHL